MKHIKSVNEWFWSPKEGDSFVKKVIDIIKNENIDVNYSIYKTTIGSERYDTYYSVVIDSEKIIFEYDSTYETSNYKIKIYNNNELKSVVGISSKYYDIIKELYKEQVKRKNIKNLPDLSDLSRASKKYNI